MLTKEETLERAFRAIDGLGKKRGIAQPSTSEHEKVHLSEVHSNGPVAEPEASAEAQAAPVPPGNDWAGDEVELISGIEDRDLRYEVIGLKNTLRGALDPGVCRYQVQAYEREAVGEGRG
jgi:hypothetical protein